jgi:hypothetical protein
MNSKLVTLMLAGVMALGSLNAEAARRMGGGKSVGQQSKHRLHLRKTRHLPTLPNPVLRLPRPHPSAHGAPCWVAWLLAWVWHGWPALSVWVKPLATS